MGSTQLVASTSSLSIDKPWSEAEEKLSEQILPPQPSGDYKVDEKVKACELVYRSWTDSY